MTQQDPASLKLSRLSRSFIRLRIEGLVLPLNTINTAVMITVQVGITNEFVFLGAFEHFKGILLEKS